jgi:opacity protein-like surface antigen
MRSLLTNALAVLLLTMTVNTVNAASPFGLFNHSKGCDSGCCDSGCSDSACCDSGCSDSNCCDSGCSDSGCCDSSCDSCCDSGCDSGCGSSLSCGSLCERDFCCCCPRPCTYWSLFGGWNNINTYRGEVAAGPHSGDFDDGWAIGIARGRKFDYGLRGELEFSYRRFEADSWNAANWNGALNGYYGMANLYRDCCELEFAGFMPYVGGGIGFGVFDGSFDSALASQEISSETAFAYQGLAGLTYRVSCMADAFVEYRYVGATEVQVDNRVTDTRLGKYSTNTNGVMFGLRFWH